MEENTNTASKYSYGLQEYLSLGYIYLIVLGIISDVIYYKFLGINILNYAAISDILLTPVNTLVNDLLVLVFVVFAVGLTYLWVFIGLPAVHKKFRDRSWYRKIVPDIEKADKKFLELNAKKRLEFILVFFPAMFIGLKIGSGSAIQKRIENGSIKVSHQITFSDDVVKSVRVIGQNSSYIFYLPEGQKEISITPIGGNIKEIKMIKPVNISQ